MEAGRGLANCAFFSHGSRPKDAASSDQLIFDTVAEMESAGFKHRYDDTFRIVGAMLPADERLLYLSLHAGMTPFACLLVSNLASPFMQQRNFDEFSAGVAEATSIEMTDSGLYADAASAKAALKSYTHWYKSASNPAILDTRKPARGDFLEASLIRCIEQSGTQSQYAFVRTGTFRLDMMATTIIEETANSIAAAARNFEW